MLPDVVRLLAQLAPGKAATVIVKGKPYVLPLIPGPHVEPPNPLEIAAKELLERDAATRAMFESVSKSLADSVVRSSEGLGALSAGQEKIAESVNRLAGTLHLPVKPIYNKSGKIVGAQRDKGA